MVRLPLSLRMSSMLVNFRPRSKRFTPHRSRPRTFIGIEILENRTLPSGTAFDFGDSPPPYATVLAENGARHVLVATGPVLGNTVTEDADGLPNDLDDGVNFLTPLLTTAASATTAAVAVSVLGSGGLLNAWIDFNQDGQWDDADG